MDAPEFAYSLNIQGGDVTFLPGLEAWLNNFIKSMVLGPYILPEGITIPIDPRATEAQVRPQRTTLRFSSFVDVVLLMLDSN